MPAPHTTDQFGDLLDPTFQDIFHEVYTERPDLLPMVYNFEPTNGRIDMKWTQVGAADDWGQFNGQVGYDSLSQGFDTTLTPIEFSSGLQVERRLFDTEQYNIMNQRPRALARAAFRTRQKHGARFFNLAASVDGLFYDNTENVAPASNLHTTTSGASTTNGFDNLLTAALTAVSVQTAAIQMRKFRGDRAEIITVMGNTLLIPVDLQEPAFEITKASGKVDTDLNNPNVHEGRYRVIEWDFLTDTNNWFMLDSVLQKESLHWTDAVPIEFAMIEDFDTLVAKWRGYMVYGLAHIDWRFMLGSIVS